MNIAVVTGASSGIGREFVLGMKDYADIDEFWLVARRENRLKELQDIIDRPCRIMPLDLSQIADLEIYSETLSKEKPNVKYMINAAGFGKYGSYKTVDTQLALNMIDLNVKALVYITQKTVEYMPAGGRIIQMGSASTYHPLPNLNIYASTKVFVKHYSRALNYELKDKKIRVTTVCPGWVKTEFFDKASIDTESERSFAKPMVKAENVVKKALKDSLKGKEISTYGIYNNLHHILSELLPKKVLINLWMQMQKNANKDS